MSPWPLPRRTSVLRSAQETNLLLPLLPSNIPHSNYRELLTHTLVFETMRQKHSTIPFGEKKPARVLDVGTGCGAWCIDTALAWGDSEFVGLDVVPCQTPLADLANPDLHKRVSWVVANFLDELPFPSRSFDLVHVRWVGSTSVRETQWTDFLSELCRVLRPGGHLEIVSPFALVHRPKRIAIAPLCSPPPDRPCLHSLRRIGLSTVTSLR